MLYMINTREIAKEYRLAHWAEIMRQRMESGLSITKFCEREGMHENRYHYWQRRLREAAASELQIQKTEIAQLPPAGWTQVNEVEEIENIESVGITIEIGRSRITVDETTAPELLTKVCKVLVSIC